MSNGTLNRHVLAACLGALLLSACGRDVQPASNAAPPLKAPAVPVTTPPAPRTTPPAPVTTPPARAVGVSFQDLSEMLPPLRRHAGLNGRVVDVGGGVSVTMKTNVDEFHSQSDICLIISETGHETGRLCADWINLDGVIFMIIPEQSSDRWIAFALVDDFVQIPSMAGEKTGYVSLGSISAYFADVPSASSSADKGADGDFGMVVTGPGINVHVENVIPRSLPPGISNPP